MTTLADWIFNKEPKHNPKLVLSTFSGDYSLADIEKGMEEAVSLFQSLGDVRRRKVALLVPQIPSYLQLFLAVNQLGGVAVPLSWQLRQDDLTALLDFLDPDIVFTVREYRGFTFSKRFEDWAESTGMNTVIFQSDDGSSWGAPQIYPGKERPLVEEPADIIACSSGSTGLPKGIMVDNEYIIKNSMALASMLQLNEEDRLFENIHPSVLHGLLWLIAGLKKHYLTVTTETFDVPRIVQLFQEKKPTKMSTTPSLFRSVFTFAKGMKALDGLESLDVTVLGGESVPQDLMEMVSSDLKCRFISFYGASEAGLLMYTADDLRKAIEWEVYEGIDSRIVEGEIQFKIPKCFLGYYKSPELTREVLDPNGWYRSGDSAALNERKKIVLMGRKKDLIKKGGQSIFPGETEGVLASHPDVKQAVLIGVPHPILGEKAIAFIVKERDVSPQSINTFCKNRIAAYKVPDEYVFIDKIPINNGKADRLLLKQRLLEES